MTQPLNAFQAGLYARLTGYTALTTALGGAFVYDHVPQDTDAPYVMIGDDTCNERDTKTYNGWELTITIHCWNFEVAGRKSVKTLMGHIYDALHKNESSITVTGFTLVDIYCEYQDTFQEEAGVEGAGDHYYHGVQRFRAVISET
jgi:hypothetical protein